MHISEQEYQEKRYDLVKNFMVAHFNNSNAVSLPPDIIVLSAIAMADYVLKELYKINDTESTES
jgi:hypothetical protein